MRLVGQYDANFRDALRDDSRTNAPIVIYDPATGTYVPTARSRRNDFRVDWLFSYRPTPGTVFFLGYSDVALASQRIDLTRENRTFFLKLGYAWLP